MRNLVSGFVGAAVVAVLAVGAAVADEALQAIDTKDLPKLGADWVKVNPYRGNPKAIEIGKEAFNENCARCHGLEAKSGGIAPDLRFLAKGDDGDEWFSYRVQNGSVRDGRVYMPKMYPTLSQEGLWCIRSWLETVHED